MDGANSASGPKLGVTLYSFTPEFHAGVSLENLLSKVGSLGLGPGVEIVAYQMIRGFPLIEDSFAQTFENLIDRHGLELTALDVDLQVGVRRGRWMTDNELDDHVSAHIEAARKLRFPILRIGGSFWEPQNPQQPAELYRRVLPLAERAGVVLAQEIHTPHTVADPVIVALRELFDQLDSPYLGFVPDAGSSARAISPVCLDDLREVGATEAMLVALDEIWRRDDDEAEKYRELEHRIRRLGGDDVILSEAFSAMVHFGRQDPRAWAEIMPHVVHVHGKFFGIHEDGDDPAVDYETLLNALVEGSYTGYISSEYEGFHWTTEEDGFTMVRRHHELCSRILASRPTSVS